MDLESIYHLCLFIFTLANSQVVKLFELFFIYVVCITFPQYQRHSIVKTILKEKKENKLCQTKYIGRTMQSINYGVRTLIGAQKIVINKETRNKNIFNF